MITARALQPQDQVGHYRIIGPLGAGGMGEVYLAEDQTLERSVALKILPPELVRSEERVRRFVREAKSASSLNHPNIVTIYEIGHDEIRSSERAAEPGSASVHFISMELVSGETLSTKIHEEKTDLRTLVGYLAQAAEGLAKAHAAGIVHRDLKPGNIMISKDGYAKVLDFGLAKLTEKQSNDLDVTSGATLIDEATGVGAVVGTVGYMSPEQVRGGVVDHRSDIFSFGCILYEAATRAKPFVADSSVETMHRILHDKPVPVEERNQKVPAELRRVIRRCLAKSPDQRFQSAKDLAIELREIVDEYESLSSSASSGSGSSAMAAPAVPDRKKFPVPMLVAGAVLVGALVVAGAIFFRGGKGSGTTGAAAPLRITAVTNRGLVNGTAISPDGRYLAYSIQVDGDRSIWVRQLATGSDVQVLPPPQPVFPSRLTFTPDGNYLYYSAADPERAGYTAIFEIPSLGGAPRKRAYDVDSRVSFSPDGKQMCFHRGVPHKNQDQLVIMDLEKGSERVLATVTMPIILGRPSWSPDGTRIAVIEADTKLLIGASVATYRVTDGRRESVGKPAWFDATDLTWLPDGSGLIASVFDPATLTEEQLWRISYPGGRTERLTTDNSSYFGLTVSADGSMLAATRLREEANLWVASPSGETRVEQLTYGSAEEGSVREFDPRPDGTILFETVQDGSGQVLTVRADGTGQRPLIGGNAFSPFFRPGVGIIYLRIGEDLAPHIWRADENGENARALTSGAGEFLIDVSRDGRQILFFRADARDVLWSVSSDGGEPRRLGISSNPSGRFSPDGTRIFHTLIHEVQGQGAFTPTVIPASGGTGGPVPVPPRIFEPEWTPDGRGITYSNEGDPRNLHRTALDGSFSGPITHFTDGRTLAHEWSPDGTHILLRRRIGSTDNLWVVDADGSHPRAVTDFELGTIKIMKWSPDGSRIYFTYGASTQSSVLIRNFAFAK
ncbi:MAG TPA: protein kinase [Candidatus Eisenbacteria bacterium]|nr:protein kinase [Candidatus Eisenbacteria bacterium]